MAKKYTFVFDGTRESFYQKLNEFPQKNLSEGRISCDVDGYTVNLVGEQIWFLLEVSHLQEAWFVCSATERENRLALCGKICYGDPRKQSAIKDFFRGAGECFLFLLLLPVIIPVTLYRLVEWVVRKILRRPKRKEPTAKDKLTAVMQRLGCLQQ